MRSLPFVLLITAGIAIVCYFSWISSPKLGSTGLFSPALAGWIDAKENDTIRTGVPFIFLGLLSGIQIVLNRSSKKWWFLGYLLLIIVVVVAEVGQLFLPFRSFDWGDVFWGAIGTAAGLISIYLISEITRTIKRHI